MAAFIFLCMSLLAPQDEGLPLLSEGQKILDGGKPLDIEWGHITPCVADWNGDGKKDLLVGLFYTGKIRLYPNRGKDDDPLLNGFELLAAAGEEIALPFG